MSKTISTIITDTPISGVTAAALTIPTLNYDADFRLKSGNANEVIMVNTTTSLDADETIRLSMSDIADIYKNAGVSADLVSDTKQGYSLLLQVNQIVKVNDSANPAYETHLPLSAHMVLKLPKAEAITNVAIQSLIARLIAPLYDKGTIKALSMLKGAISPKGL